MKRLAQLELIARDLSVLYVEDNKDLREAFSTYLRNFFKTVTVCEDGEMGLNEYKKASHDIVITDINMPKMNGLEMSKEIKSINQSQHIIIVSAYKDSDNYAEAVHLGIDGYILKPIEFDQVNSALLKLCTHIKNSKENLAYKEHLEELVASKTQEMIQSYISDSLTGLPNRIALNEELDLSKENTILLLNIDNFRIVNYNFGFSLGDQIIKKIASVLKQFDDNMFKLYRMQADEFVFLSMGNKITQAQTLAESIKEYFANNNIFLENIELNISFTMAIDSAKDKDLLRSTSLTVQEIRQIGKNHIGVYNENSDFEKLQKNNLIWIEKIKVYFTQNSFTIFFQPIKNIKTGEIIKYEVLSRIITPDNEIISPNMFLKPLTMAGLLTNFTKRVIDMAFAFMQDNNIAFSINITSEDFKENYLVSYLEEKRREYSIDSSRVIIEILESVSSIGSHIVLEQLKELKNLGYKIAIDDFGTENSNFSRLLTLKVDYIKIDGSFVKNIVTDTNAQEIVKAIVVFGHNIGCEIIAEFVHNKEVYEKISEYGVDFAQGYYIGEPKATLMLNEG